MLAREGGALLVDTEFLIVTSHISKSYGPHWVLQNISFSLPAGRIIGLVGPNGSGKTTLLKIISGLVFPTRGSVSVFGRQLTTNQPPLDNIGLVLENGPMIDNISAYRNLAALASIRGVIGRAEIVAALQHVGLDPASRVPVRKFSLGMRQRLALAQALMEKPRLLLLDEPTNGLDPQGIAELRELLIDLKRAGTGVLLASHLLTEVERVCDQVLIINEGRLLHSVMPSTAANRASVLISVTNLEDGQVLRSWAQAQALPFTGDGQRIKLSGIESVPELVRQLVALGVNIQAVEPEKDAGLETVFLEVMQGGRR